MAGLWVIGAAAFISSCISTCKRSGLLSLLAGLVRGLAATGGVLGCRREDRALAASDGVIGLIWLVSPVFSAFSSSTCLL